MNFLGLTEKGEKKPVIIINGCTEIFFLMMNQITRTADSFLFLFSFFKCILFFNYIQNEKSKHFFCFCSRNPIRKDEENLERTKKRFQNKMKTDEYAHCMNNSDERMNDVYDYYFIVCVRFL